MNSGLKNTEKAMWGFFLYIAAQFYTLWGLCILIGLLFLFSLGGWNDMDCTTLSPSICASKYFLHVLFCLSSFLYVTLSLNKSTDILFTLKIVVIISL